MACAYKLGVRHVEGRYSRANTGDGGEGSADTIEHFEEASTDRILARWERELA
jgi:hypothetical protein